MKITLISFLLSSFILNAQCWKTITTKTHSVAAIQTDGTLWLWGRNDEGQLGDGTTLSRNIPTQVENDSADWESVTTGFTTLAIKKDGTLWGWGSCQYGQLANDDKVDKLDKLVPIRVGTKSDWVMAESSSSISFGIKKNGTLWAWGVYAYSSNSSLLENESPPVEDTFVYQVGNQNDWQSIWVGNNFAFAIKTNGTLWGYGSNEYGQLGDGTNTSSAKFIQIGNDNNWKSISIGGNTVLGLKIGGSLFAWGSNSGAAFGNGTKDEIVNDVGHNKPILIGNDKWLSVSTSGMHTLAVNENGTLWTWGGASFYKADSSIDTTIPNKIGENNNWRFAMTSELVSFGMLTTARLWSWGFNYSGELGGENIDFRFSDNPYFINCGCSTIAPTGVSDQSFCNGAKLSDIKLSGTNIKWYDKEIKGFLQPSTSLLVDGKTYYASQTNDDCESRKRFAVKVSVTTVLEPTGNIEQTFCSPHGTPKKLSDLEVTGVNIKWYDSLLEGNVLADDTPLYDNKTYYACSVINGCESSRLGIKVIDLIAPPTGPSNQVFCNGTTLSEVVTNSIGRRWYTTEIGGFSIPESTLLANNTTYYASESYGTQDVGFCESTKRLGIQIVVNTTSPPLGETIQTFYNVTKISDIAVQGASLKFYDVAQEGNGLDESSLVVNNKKYYISQTIKNCESPQRLEALVYLIFTEAPVLVTNDLPDNPQVKDADIKGSNVKWYTSLIDFESQMNELLLISYLQEGTTYYISQTVDGVTNTAPLKIYYNGKTLSLNEFLLEKENTIIYPNPTKTYFALSNPYLERVEVYSLDGKIIKVFLKQDKYDIDNLAKGIYLIRIRNEAGVINTQKLIKQ